MRIVARAAAIVLLVAGSAAAGWFGARMGTPETRLGTDLAELGYAHLEAPSTTAAPNRSETVSTQVMQPLISLDNGVSLTLPEPDLSALGFSLSGRESIMSERGRTLRLTYSNAQGDSFALLLRPRGHPQKTDVRLSRRGDVSVVHWLDGAIELAVAARLPNDRTLAIADTVREAMRDNQHPPMPENDRLAPAPASLSAENTLLTTPPLQDEAVVEPLNLHQ
jgi:anti-sigma factor RsiW